MKNIIKRGCALFIATMCIMSTFSFSFASGWPSVDEGDTLTATGATNTDRVHPWRRGGHGASGRKGAGW